VVGSNWQTETHTNAAMIWDIAGYQDRQQKICEEIAATKMSLELFTAKILLAWLPCLNKPMDSNDLIDHN
jgi:hypothetical protein